MIVSHVHSILNAVQSIVFFRTIKYSVNPHDHTINTSITNINCAHIQNHTFPYIPASPISPTKQHLSFRFTSNVKHINSIMGEANYCMWYHVVVHCRKT